MSTTMFVLALADGARAGLLCMLLVAAASAFAALPAFADCQHEAQARRALLTVFGCLLSVAAFSWLARVVKTAWLSMLPVPELLAPFLLVALVGLWRFGSAGRTARAFTLAPAAALRLALETGEASRRLLLIHLLAAAGGGLFLAEAALAELTALSLLASGIALWLQARSPELRLACAFALALGGGTIAQLAGVERVGGLAGAAVMLATLSSLWTFVRSRA